MSNTKFKYLLMALVAMSFFKTSASLAQTIKTPNTSKQLLEDKTAPAPTSSPKVKAEEESESTSYSSPQSNAASPRRLHQHGLGLGLGQTFLLGDYAKRGENKITADVLYSYAASYSFDLLVDAHMSKHTKDDDKMKLMALTTSIKGRFVEYDNFSPFFLGGLGFYAPQAKRDVDGKQEWSTQKVTFGLNFGGGLDLRLNEHYVVGILGQMHWPFKIAENSGPDVKGYYFKLLLTGMYLF